MHHFELNGSSIQQLWYLGTARKQSEVFPKHTFPSGCATSPSLRLGTLLSLPVKESRVFLAPWNIPLAQLYEGSQCFIYRSRLYVWRFACSIPLVLWQVRESGFLPLRFGTSLALSRTWLCRGFSFWNALTGSKRVKPLWTKHKHKGSLAVEYLMLALLPSRTFCTSPIPSSHGGQESVSTPRRQCVLSRRPASGGCGAAWGGGNGSGGICDSVGQQSGAGHPDPSPRHGFPHPPRLTRGHCCTGGFHYLPAGSWCCNRDRSLFLIDPSSGASSLDCARVVRWLQL